MTGVGIDLLEIERLERALERRPALAQRLFTDDERAYAVGRARPGQHLAARFCAKEAVAKALGMEAWSWQEVEIVSTAAAPELRLSGAVAARADELNVSVSISLTHTETTAGAVALAVAGVTLPDWLQPLPDAPRMRDTDRWAIEDQGIASFELMELAGAGLARVADETAPDGLVVAVCGKGNNGGDGLVAARLLRDAGRVVRVVLLGDPQELTGDPQINLGRLPGEPPQRWSANALDGAAVVIDAILGTGFEGEPRGTPAEAIEAIANLDGVPVVAADVPSGVDASTGEIAGTAVTAAATATFHLAKPGLWINPGKSHAGQVRVIDIAIPAGAPVEPPDVCLLRDAVLEQIPRRTANTTKFDSGYVLVAGGSRGLTGAPSLAAEAAMRAGAGYVTACVPQSTEVIFEMRLLEAMTRGLPDDDGAHTAAGVDAVIELTERGGALVLGPRPRAQ